MSKQQLLDAFPDITDQDAIVVMVIPFEGEDLPHRDMIYVQISREDLTAWLQGTGDTSQRPTKTYMTQKIMKVRPTPSTANKELRVIPIKCLIKAYNDAAAFRVADKYRWVELVGGGWCAISSAETPPKTIFLKPV
jgi:hypothetical protein